MTYFPNPPESSQNCAFFTKAAIVANPQTTDQSHYFQPLTN